MNLSTIRLLCSVSFLLLFAGWATSCSDVTITNKELDDLPGIERDRVTTYRIPEIPAAQLEQLWETLSNEQLVSFLLQWIEERQEVFRETWRYDQIGNLTLYEFTGTVQDSIYTERYHYSEQFSLLEIEVEINGQPCFDCRPDRVERELNLLLEPVKEEVFQQGEFLHENILTYNQPGELFSIQRNRTPGGNELYTEFITWIPRDQRTSLIRRQRRVFAEGQRVQIIDYGYDPAGYLARVTEIEDFPQRVITAETRYITLEGDRNRNWILRIRDRQWLEVRRIDYN